MGRTGCKGVSIRDLGRGDSNIRAMRSAGAMEILSSTHPDGAVSVYTNVDTFTRNLLNPGADLVHTALHRSQETL